MRHALIAAAAALAFAACSPAAPEREPEPTTAPPTADAPATAGTGSSLDRAQADHMLKLHNAARADVGVGPLRWSADLATYAQQWADRLAADGCRFEHRPDGRYGENLAMGSGGFDAAKAFGGWHREKRLYGGGKLTPSSWSPSGHYTQIVWRSTERVGCAMAPCRDLAIWVCNYDPPGNVLGQKPY